MSKLFVAALGVVLLVGVGCQKDHNTDTSTQRTTSNDGTTHTTVTTEKSDTMRGADDCPHCPGVQTATAAGKCPVCGAQVK
jgi:hypothetical protein